MTRRVVITGMGTVNPLSNDVKEFWQALCAGRNGISVIEQLDTAPFKVHFGGEVSDPVGSLIVEDNKLMSEQPGSVAVLNQTRLPVKFIHNGIGRNVQIVFDGNPGEEQATWKLGG